MTAAAAIGKAPHVFRAINRVTAAFAKDGIPKAHTNLQDQYQYRSIDDVLNRLAPLLARHGLCVLPRVLSREAQDRIGEANTLLVNVSLLVAFDLVSCRDGSKYTIQAWGEALDVADKATAKAMSAAYKSAMLQVFCVPVAGQDADATTHRLKVRVREREPVEGWTTWAEGICDMIGVCETPEALDRVRTRQAALLEALRSERADLYARIGQAFSSRAQQLAQQPNNGEPKDGQSTSPRRRRGHTKGEPEPAAAMEPIDA